MMCFWVRYVVHAWAAMIYAFTRRGFGVEFFNFWGLSGLLVLSAWSVVTVAPQDAAPLSFMCIAFLALAAWHRVRSPKYLFGQAIHSRYMGWPWICDILPISEHTAKASVEPAMVGLFGLGMVEYSPSLGAFVIIGALACLLDWIYLNQRDYKRARQVRDAEIQQERLMESYDRYFKR
ncbi:MAG: hypothetical protein AB7O38_15170 [Pirellulaceae bacterium]